MAVLITVPLVNPNENEALLAALHVQEGQAVSAGQPLATLETTKSTLDLCAEADGYILRLGVAEGQTLRAGEPFAYLGSSPDETLPDDKKTVAEPAAPQSESESPPAGMRITQPALKLARQAGLQLESLPLDRLVTESVVREALGKRPALSPSPQLASPFPPGERKGEAGEVDATALVIYGGGGHAKALIDLIRALGIYHIVGVLDDGHPSGDVLGVPVLGGGDQLATLYAQGVRLAVNAVGGIGSVQSRINVFNKLAEAGFACPALVHPRATLEPSARLSAGVQVFPHAYVGSAAQVGAGSIINTGAIVSHDCVIGQTANLSPGAILAGEVRIGDGSLVGMGATVNLRVSVGAYARIGNSAVVKDNVPDKGIVKAGAVWP